jgi:hypothetical protein
MPKDWVGGLALAATDGQCRCPGLGWVSFAGNWCQRLRTPVQFCESM